MKSKSFTTAYVDRAVITFEGKFDRMRAVGINRLPVQRPIPIWFGGRVEAARRRVVVLGDGLVMDWPLPDQPLESEWQALFDEMRVWRRDAGHADESGFETRISAYLARSPEQWRQTAEEWQALGASHLAVRTTCLGLNTVDAHLEPLALARDALADLIDAADGRALSDSRQQ